MVQIRADMMPQGPLCVMVTAICCCIGGFLLAAVAAVGPGYRNLITEEECDLSAANTSTLRSPPSCDISWTQNTTFTQCCQMEVPVIGRPAANVTPVSKTKTANGMACCTDTFCPASTNYTVNEVAGCTPLPHESQNVSAPAVVNVTVISYCCHTFCCIFKKQTRIPQLVNRLEHVERINHQWLVILSSTVAICGFVAIAFSIYMCHAHELMCSLPSVANFIKERRRGPRSIPSVSIGSPPLQMVAKNVTDVDDAFPLLPAKSSNGLRTSDTYSTADSDKQWLLNSVVDGTATDSRASRSSDFSDVSVVYQQRIQPARR